MGIGRSCRAGAGARLRLVWWCRITPGGVVPVPFWVRWQRAESIFAGGPAQGRRARPLGWTAYEVSHGMAWHGDGTICCTTRLSSTYGLRSTEHPTKVIYLETHRCEADRPLPASAVSSGGARWSWQADSPAIARVARRCIDDGDEADPGPGGWLACWW